MTFLGVRNVYTGATLELDFMIAKGEGSGVTKAPADPAVRGAPFKGGAKSLFECGTILKT